MAVPSYLLINDGRASETIMSPDGDRFEIGPRTCVLMNSGPERARLEFAVAASRAGLFVMTGQALQLHSELARIQAVLSADPGDRWFFKCLDCGKLTESTPAASLYRPIEGVRARPTAGAGSATFGPLCADCYRAPTGFPCRSPAQQRRLLELAICIGVGAGRDANLSVDLKIEAAKLWAEFIHWVEA